MSSPQDSKWLPRVQDVLIDVFSSIPVTREPKHPEPSRRSREIVRSAAVRAAAVAGGLAVPPGPLGMLTILPDLYTIWKIQAQMTADIAGAYDKKLFLRKEQMMYCLFRHAGGQVVRDLVVRVGERLLIRRAAMNVLQRIMRRIGIGVTERIAARSISRWLPIVGAGAIAVYAYYDTRQVGATAIEFFGSELAEDATELAELPELT